MVEDKEVLTKISSSSSPIDLDEQKKPILDFKHNLEIEENQSSKNEYYKKVILPSNEELEKHKVYLKNNLKKNYFN